MDLLIEAELKRALAAPGCPICRVGEEAMSRYLRFVLHESVNDSATRSRLAAAWGFCRRHAWHFLRLEWQSVRDGLGTAIISEALLKTAAEILAEHTSVERTVKGLTPTGKCPACELQTRHEAYALTVALACLGEEAWRERFRRSDGLCLPHLRAALDRREADEPVRWIVRDHQARLRRLVADLEAYIRLPDRSTPEPTEVKKEEAHG